MTLSRTTKQRHYGPQNSGLVYKQPDPYPHCQSIRLFVEET